MTRTKIVLIVLAVSVVGFAGIAGAVASGYRAGFVFGRAMSQASLRMQPLAAPQPYLPSLQEARTQLLLVDGVNVLDILGSIAENDPQMAAMFQDAAQKDEQVAAALLACSIMRRHPEETARLRAALGETLQTRVELARIEAQAQK